MPTTSATLDIPAEKLNAFCRRWKIRELALFGSAVRGELTPDSDIDMLVTFASDTRWSLLDHAAMEEELETLFGRQVDLLTKKGIMQSRNSLRRQAILESAEIVYAAA